MTLHRDIGIGEIHLIKCEAGAVLEAPSGVAQRRRRSLSVATVRIPLSSRKYPGLFALVDEVDVARVRERTWFVHARRRGSGLAFYAYTATRAGGKQKNVLLHRFIMESPEGVEVDHRNGDGLDCRRSNMRHATRAQNMRNRPPKHGRAFKGVYYESRRAHWIAYLVVDRRRVHLGSYATEEEAARAYDDAAREHFGEFARLNFPEIAA